MGVVVIGGGGGGTPPTRTLSEAGNEIQEDGQTVAVFPNTKKGRKDCIRYLKMLDKESED